MLKLVPGGRGTNVGERIAQKPLILRSAPNFKEKRKRRVKGYLSEKNGSENGIVREEK